MAVLLFLLVVVAALAVFLLLKYHWTRRRMYLLASQLDGPTAWPVVGNGHSFMCDADGEDDNNGGWEMFIELIQVLVGLFHNSVFLAQLHVDWPSEWLTKIKKPFDEIQNCFCATPCIVLLQKHTVAFRKHTLVTYLVDAFLLYHETFAVTLIYRLPDKNTKHFCAHSSVFKGECSM